MSMLLALLSTENS